MAYCQITSLPSCLSRHLENGFVGRDGFVDFMYYMKILYLTNPLNSENGRLPKTESRSSKENEF